MTISLRTFCALLLLCSSSFTFAQVNKARALPHVLVYKASPDFNDKVPVVLSADKKKVVSYPAPSDVKALGAGFPPVRLHKGYLLSRYGVSINTVFMPLPYTKYASLTTTPSPEGLYRMIDNKNPLIELCDCGVMRDSVEMKLNKLIDGNLLRTKCKVIK